MRNKPLPGLCAKSSPLNSGIDLTVKPNPTTKAVENPNYKRDEEEDRVIENMDNKETFGGQTFLERKLNLHKK